MDVLEVDGRARACIEADGSGGSLFGSTGEVGDMGFLFSSCRRFSRPSTRLSRASRTSVLGPRFLGTASRAVS